MSSRLTPYVALKDKDLMKETLYHSLKNEDSHSDGSVFLHSDPPLEFQKNESTFKRPSVRRQSFQKPQGPDLFGPLVYPPNWT